MHALVTGGGGFLGRAITEQLLARGDAVTILARHRYREVEALGARGVLADLTRLENLDGVLEGVDVVFHVASRTGVWGPRDEFMAVNVDGTRNLVEACWAQGVDRLVYTSSPSATFHGGDAVDLTEAEASHPDQFDAAYPESKARAEVIVQEANGPHLTTTILRPHLIYGPREPHMLPRLIDRHQRGRLRRIGDGRNKVSLTYIDNAAAAHLQAADALVKAGPTAGRAYFIADSSPVTLWEWIDRFFVGIGLPPVQGSISPALARRISGVLEWVWTTFSLDGEPPMTRFAAAQLSTSHTYDLSAARADFGYTPPVDGDEGLRRTIAWFRAHRPTPR